MLQYTELGTHYRMMDKLKIGTEQQEQPTGDNNNWVPGDPYIWATGADTNFGKVARVHRPNFAH